MDNLVNLKQVMGAAAGSWKELRRHVDMDISHAGKLTLEERDGGAYPTTAVTYNNSMIIKYQRCQKMKGYQPSVA